MTGRTVLYLIAAFIAVAVFLFMSMVAHYVPKGSLGNEYANDFTQTVYYVGLVCSCILLIYIRIKHKGWKSMLFFTTLFLNMFSIFAMIQRIRFDIAFNKQYSHGEPIELGFMFYAVMVLTICAFIAQLITFLLMTLKEEKLPVY